MATPIVKQRVCKNALGAAADRYRAGNLEAAGIILQDVERYGECSLLVQWARLFLENDANAQAVNRQREVVRLADEGDQLGLELGRAAEGGAQWLAL